MNPNSATMRATDLCALLGVSDQSIYRWMARPYPVNHDFARAPRGRMFALPEVVVRLRERRKQGLFGSQLARVVEFDRAVRAEREFDDHWLGECPESRTDRFAAVLTDAENERFSFCRRAVGNAAVSCGLHGIERLRHIILVHPGVARFVLTGQAEELPVSDIGWQSWVRALDVLNIPIEKEAA